MADGFKEETNENILDEASAVLKKGGTVIMPTETVYGLAALMNSEEGIKKIYGLKQRDADKPLSIFIRDAAQLSEVCDMSGAAGRAAMALAGRFWPGPLTMVLKKKTSVPDAVTAGLGTVGVRIPDNELALSLLERLGEPLAVTSVNISGKEPAISYGQAVNNLSGEADLAIDGGDVLLRLPSTVVEIDDGGIHILREGTISSADLKKTVSGII